MADVPEAHLRCPEDLVMELTLEDSTMAVTINHTGVARLAADWLNMKKEIVALRKKLNLLEGTG